MHDRARDEPSGSSDKFAGLNASPASCQNTARMALDHRRARRHLMAADPVMAELIRRAGPCRLGASRAADPFFLLLRAIVSQQLSTKAAATIFGRLCALFPGDAPTPARLLALDDVDAARRGPQHPEDALRARPGVAGRATAGSTWRGSTPRRTTTALDGAHRRARHRHLDRRDLPALPAAPARHPAGRRSRAADGDAARLPAADPADAEAGAGSWPRSGGHIDRWPPGICGAASKCDPAGSISRSVIV